MEDLTTQFRQQLHLTAPAPGVKKFLEMVKDEVHDRRTFVDVLRHDVTNYVYFFAPLVITYNVGWYVASAMIYRD